MNDYTTHSRPHKSNNRCYIAPPDHHSVVVLADAALDTSTTSTTSSSRSSDRWCWGNTPRSYEYTTPQPNSILTTPTLRMMPPTPLVAVEHPHHHLTNLHRCGGGGLSDAASSFRRSRHLGAAGLAMDDVSSTPHKDEGAGREKFKRRNSKKRVGFEPHPVQQVHYPAPTTLDEDGPPTLLMVGADGYSLTGSSSTTRGGGFDSVDERWYSHRELVEMKRAAKRACTTRPDLEYALNDAYNCNLHHRGRSSSSQPTSVDEETDTERGWSRRTASSSQSASSSQGESLDAQQMLLEIPFFREQRGMERWCSKRHALSRGLTVLQVKTEVFVAQARKSMGGSSNGTAHGDEASDVVVEGGRLSNAVGPAPHGPHPDSFHHGNGPRVNLPGDSDAADAAAARDDDVVCLADACAAASAPAVRFAQLLGRIDAIEAAEPDITQTTVAALTASSDSALFPEDWSATNDMARLDGRRTAGHVGDYVLEESAAFFFD